MTPEHRQFLRHLLGKTQDFLSPLTDVVDKPRAFYALCAQMGWNLEGVVDVSLNNLTAVLGELQKDVDAIAAAAEEPDENAAADAAHAALRNLLDRLEILETPLFSTVSPNAAPELAREFSSDLRDYLVLRWLFRHASLLFQLGRLLSIIRYETAPPLYGADNKLLRFAVPRYILHLDDLWNVSANALSQLLRGLRIKKPLTAKDFASALGGFLDDRLREMMAAGGTYGLKDLTATLDPQGILAQASWLPAPIHAGGPVMMQWPSPVPATLTIGPGSWHLSWAPAGSVGDSGYPIMTSEVLELSLMGGGDAQDCPATSFSVKADHGNLRLIAAGGLRLSLPETLLSTETGKLSGAVCGRVTHQLGGTPVITLDAATLQTESEVTLSGPAGLKIGAAAVTLAGVSFSADAGLGTSLDLRVAGTLLLGDSIIAVDARYEHDNGRFSILSTGEVYLGNGIWLFPADNEPVLELQAQGSGSATFGVNALFKVPRAVETDGTETVAVSGSLSLRASQGQWFVESFSAAGAISRQSLTLPGHITLTDAQVSLSLDTSSQIFKASLGGALTLGATAGEGSVSINVDLIFDDVTDPTSIRIDSALELGNVNLFHLAFLLHARARLRVNTRRVNGGVTATGELMLEQAAAGFFPLDTIDPVQPHPDHFQLAVTQLTAQWNFHPAGFVLLATGGVLRLPPVFGPGPNDPSGLPVTISLSGENPLRVQASTSGLQLEGEFVFANFEVRLDGGVISNGEGPALQVNEAKLRFHGKDLPVLHGVRGMASLPLPGAGSAHIGFQDMTFDMTGLPAGVIHLAEDLPGIPLGGGFTFTLLGGMGSDHPVTGLTVTHDDGAVRFRVDTAMRLSVPASMLLLEGGGQVAMKASGSMNYQVGDSFPEIAVHALTVSGSFQLGGLNGLLIDNGELSAEGISHMLKPAPANPFIIRLSGDVTLPNGPRGGLQNARFIFEGNPLPSFDLDGVSGGSGNMELAGGYLPVNVTNLRLQFDPTIELPQKFLPQHVTMVVDAEVNIQNVLTGSVRDLTIRFDANGMPQPAVDALMLQVTGLELVEGFSLGGGLAIGGLTQIPDALVLAGRLGGKVSGAGVEALVAFGVVDGLFMPLGAALEASMGPAGIPLGQTGFLLTGASGGVSFTGGNADPDDLRAYVQLDADGKVNSQPRPPATDAPDPTAQGPIAHAADPPTDAPLEFQCPQEPCPPPSVGILYQPHPDEEQYAHRVIFKFSALDQASVDRVLGAAGISKEALQGMTPDAVATQVGEAVIGSLGAMLPFTTEQLDLLRTPLQEAVAASATRALQGSGSVYDALVKAAYKGIRAPNTTLKLTGTLSYVGVSAFLSVTGGVVFSPTIQSAGIVGSINLVGIPVGTLRGFLTANNDAGAFDPALCGDLSFALGPLDLGKLRMTFRAGFDITTFAAHAITLSEELGQDLLAGVLQVVDDDLFNSHGRDPVAALAALEPQQTLALVALLMQQPMRADLRGFLVALFDRLWTNFNPQMLLCGSAQPKLFGLPLDGELVGVSANVTKTEFAASFRFSPMALFGKLFGGVLPAFDAMKLALRLVLPDPRPFIEAGIGGDLNSPAKMLQVAEEGLAYAMSEAVATIEYAIAPMGFRMVDAEARLIMPDLLNHPSNREIHWLRPEERPGNLPSRLEVLLAAVLADKLGNIFWRGTSEELKALPGLRNGAAIGNLSLREDYFPHGGVLGAGRIALPKLFTQPPPVAEFNQLLTGGLMDKVHAAQTLLEGLTTAETLGQMGFYMPAPNPPAGAFAEIHTPRDLVALMQGHPFDLDSANWGDFYPVQESFFRGSLGSPHRPVTILGIPVGSADLEVVPPDAGREGILLARARVPRGSWLRDLVGEAALEFSIRQCPPEPIEAHFGRIASALNHPDAQAHAIAMQLAGDLNSHLPKISLVAAVQELRLPAQLRNVLQLEGHVSAELHAYSLLYAYDPAFSSDDPLGAARNFGGLVLRIRNLTFGAGPFKGKVHEALFALNFKDPERMQLPRMSADMHVGRVAVPGLALNSARMVLDTDPLAAQLVGEVEFIDLGSFRIEPLAGRRSLQVRVDAVSGSLHMDPARLTVPALGGGSSVRIHGKTVDSPFTFDLSGSWEAGLSIVNLALNNPFDASGTPLFTLPGTVRVNLRGKGLASAEFELDFRHGSTVTILPGVTLDGRAQGRLVIRSDGSFAYTGQHGLTLPQFTSSGMLDVRHTPPQRRQPAMASVRLTDARAQLSGLPAFTADFEVLPSQLRAVVNFGSGWMGISGLGEFRAGLWDFTYSWKGGPVTLTAKNALAARILGNTIAEVQKLSLSMEPVPNQMKMNAWTKGWVPLLPSLLEVQPAELQMELKGSGGTLSLRGSVRALRRIDRNWHVNQSMNLVMTDGPFEVILLQGNQVAFLPLSGPLRRISTARDQTQLLLERNAAGTLSLVVRNVGIHFAGTARASAVIDSSGRARFTWTGHITGNGLTYEPGTDLALAMALLQVPPVLTLSLPRGRLRGTFPGWPAAGVVFPARALELTMPPEAGGEARRSGKPWQTVPGFPFAEFRVTAPEFSYRLSGETLVNRLRGGLEIRSTGKRPNGQPWAQASTSFDVPVDGGGRVTLQFPTWPAIGDPYRALREACRANARLIHVLPPFPVRPNPPARPRHPRPRVGFDPAWVAYDTARRTYDTVTLPAYERAKKAYDDVVARLNTALAACEQANPLPPQLPLVPALSFRVGDLLT